jgi:hypothetical protein
MSRSAGSPGEVFLDTRGGGRALRLTWHHEVDVVVLSLWQGPQCTATFRLDAADVNAFIDALVDGMRVDPWVDQMLPSGRQAPETGLAHPAAAS